MLEETLLLRRESKLQDREKRNVKQTRTLAGSSGPIPGQIGQGLSSMNRIYPATPAELCSRCPYAGLSSR